MIDTIEPPAIDMPSVGKSVGLNTLLEVDVQYAVDDALGEKPPAVEHIVTWARAVFAELDQNQQCASEVTVRIVGQDEMLELNSQYRGKSKLTNVLSFPLELESDVVNDLELKPLGDIVICNAVIEQEAIQQNKEFIHHYAHMVIHGVLHLSGFDHQSDQQAEQMESLEIKVLHLLAIANPYH